MIHGSGIPTNVTEHLTDTSLDALCDAKKAVDRGEVQLAEIKAVLLRIEALLASNIEQSQAVSAELQTAGASLAADGRALAEELRNDRQSRGNEPTVP